MLSRIYVVVLCFVVALFGISIHCQEVDPLKIYEIKKGNFSVKVTNYGARVISVILPDKNGELGDIVLGYDTAEEYTHDGNYFGAIVGRVANRIGGAKFTLNGTNYTLVANNGPNMLHGGKKGFSQVVWKVKDHQENSSSPSITLTYDSFDGEEGFPGNVTVSVTYAIEEQYNLRIIMTGEDVTKATPVNLAHHGYWNLGNHNSGNILSDEVQLFASHITPVDTKNIPTGELAHVKNTPFNFLKPQVIGDAIKKFFEGSLGYDINYAVDGPHTRMKPIATVFNKDSGRFMKLSANEPGVQFYTGNFINNVTGKGGYIYQAHAGLCLETQGYPDAVNQPNFPSQIVNPGQYYNHEMLFEFLIRT